MKKYKILNLYACLGGNRYKWDEVADNLEITAVELDPEAARLYKERFPKDTVIIADAHEYLLEPLTKNLILYGVHHLVQVIHEQGICKTKYNYNQFIPDLKLYEEVIIS
jgi:DNA (cytosine-5)-methyltransferase 1